MKIDWKKVHEVLPGARFVAWDSDMAAYAYTELPAYDSDAWGVDGDYDVTWKRLRDFDCLLTAPWRSSLIEFPSHYGETEECYLGGLRDLSASLQEQADQGKAAAKRAKAIDRVIAAADEFLKAHGKALDAAGIEVVFKERQQ